MLNEADTRAKLIDPKLRSSGWDEENIIRNFTISAGKVNIFGDRVEREEKKFADYLLTHKKAFPIAVVEAKDESHISLDGMQQAKEYAEILKLYFAYSTNGSGIEEFDFITNTQKTVQNFPTSEELFERLASQNQILAKKLKKNPLEYPLYYSPAGKNPRYYQLIAIQKVIEAIVNGQKRVLVTMATGSGKTKVAFQVVWKLYNSGYFKRILFVADRRLIRDQAFELEFGQLKDAREKIIEGKAPQVRDIYFTTYQTLYTPKNGKRLFETYDPNFFDLVIIDECHRSGWNLWYDILKHFSGAVHFGMTATPKRDDNIDTYKYFGNPVYEYSLSQGVKDGFLANYLIQRILTNLHKEGGVDIEEQRLQGAEVFYPEEFDDELKTFYTSGEFERKIVIPDLTKKVAQHLAGLLKKFGKYEKTIVFCVNNDHARGMTKELQNHFASEGVSNYAVTIVSEEMGAHSLAEAFKDSEKKTPVIATTVDLLSTGIDIPAAKNIVFLRPISSVVLFNQILGRGSRIDETVGKYFFRIIDYVNATRLFSVLLPEKEEIVEGETGPSDYLLEGKVVIAKTETPIIGAKITVITKAHEHLQTATNELGIFSLENLPRNKITLQIFASGFIRRELRVSPTPEPQPEIYELKRERKIPAKVTLGGVDVYIHSTAELSFDVGGNHLKEAEYKEYSKEEVAKLALTLEDLKNIWLDEQKRKEFLTSLKEKSISPEALAKLIEREDADFFDVLAHITFDAPIISRDERAQAIEIRKQEFLSSFGQEAQPVLLALLDQYRIGGLEDISRKEVFALPEFQEIGIEKIIENLGGVEKAKEAISQLHHYLYLEEP
jgi:type I restriction enzyme R subunit